MFDVRLFNHVALVQQTAEDILQPCTQG